MGFQPWKVSRADVADGAAGRLWKGEMVMFLGSYRRWGWKFLGSYRSWSHIVPLEPHFWAHNFLLAWQTCWRCGALS